MTLVSIRDDLQDRVDHLIVRDELSMLQRKRRRDARRVEKFEATAEETTDWTFVMDDLAPGVVDVEQPPVVAVSPSTSADIEDLIAEVFGHVDCSCWEHCCSRDEAYEIFGDDPEIYAEYMGFSITTRP